MRKAEYFFASEDEARSVRCGLCPEFCLIPSGGRGRCLARVNKDGVLYAENYADVAALSMDPIEKKPLYHFYPGSEILSAASWGCNLSCRWCQNWDLSQKKRHGRIMQPSELADLTLAGGNGMIAFTYSEPFVWYEYILDFAKIVKAENTDFKIVLVSNGYVNPAPLKRLMPYIDAANIDIKAMSDEISRKFTGGYHMPAMNTAESLYKEGVHVELTYLMVTGANDSDEMVEAFARWAAETLAPSVPVHLSAYYPAYKMKTPPTDPDKMGRAFNMARNAGLYYVYTGNAGVLSRSDTRCPGCGQILVKREGYHTKITGVSDGKCSSCGRQADFTGLDENQP